MTHRRIDVHQHVIPPAYAAWLRARGIQDAGGHAAIDRRSAEALFPQFAPGRRAS